MLPIFQGTVFDTTKSNTATIMKKNISSTSTLQYASKKKGLINALPLDEEKQQHSNP